MTAAILIAGPAAGLLSAYLYFRLINAIGNALFGNPAGEN